jgi:hypothetical protein
MKIPCWKEGMSDAETKDVAYMERNLLALRFADGWYLDVVPDPHAIVAPGAKPPVKARYPGYARVLSLDSGMMTFHIPDDFDVGNLRPIQPNWDGHTTRQKWEAVFALFGIKETPDVIQP